MIKLNAKNLARYGLRRGAYDGGTKRRFVLFETIDGYEIRSEYDTKAKRDQTAMTRMRAKRTRVPL